MEKWSIKTCIIMILILSNGLVTACQDTTNKAAIAMNQNIIQAVKSGDTSLVKQLLEGDSHVNQRNAKGESLLLLATHNNDLAMAKLLVSRGAEVNQQSDNQDSPFLYAGAAGRTELLVLFLAHGARFDVFNRYRGTALIPACERGHVATVRLLANTPKFPIDHVNRLGWTALMEAVILGDGSAKYVEIVDILIQAGVNKMIPDNNQVTALAHAQRMGHTAIAKLLQE